MSEISKGLANGLTNYGDPEFAKYLRRSFAKSMGYTNESLDKPIVGICYTESSFNNCHRHFPEMLEAVKLGVLVSGALPKCQFRPVGTGYMEDFHYSGGLDGVLGALASQLNLQTLDVTGQSLEQRLQEDRSKQADQSVIRDIQNPVDAKGGLIACLLYTSPSPRDS